MNDTAKYAGLGIGAFLIAKVAMAALTPTCEISGIQRAGDVAWTNGPDYAIIVSAMVKNIGSSSNVTVEASISTTEGDFQNDRSVNILPGQSRRVDFSFTEPSIGVTPKSVDVHFNCS